MRLEIYKSKLAEIRKLLDNAEIEKNNGNDYNALKYQIKAYSSIYNLDVEMLKDAKK
jgi:hypothetical protein